MDDKEMEDFSEGDFTLLEFFEKREEWRRSQFPEKYQKDLFDDRD